ncbi:MAG TPA: type II secretion system F family protein [Acidimicrobiales bacterium]|nr:type II secretion system F family protein [Acidimicrobiales bacterium]
MPDLFASGGLGPVLAVVVALSVTGVLTGAALVAADRIGLRTKLREIDDLYKFVDVRDQELALSFTDRVSAPVLGTLTKVGWRFSPAGRVEEIRSMLRRAGRPEVDTDRYIAMRVLSLIAAPFAALAAWTFAASQGGMLRLAITGLAVAGCTILPSRKLRSQVETREQAILRQLPDIMDLLVICMEAGLGFTAAVSRTVANIEGEMSDEFAVALGEMRAGASRAEALGSLAERVQIPEIRSFVMAIRQADQFGISVSTVLRNQADDMRVARRQVAQEKAQKAPVKMLVPMVFCIFPPMFIVTIGPAGIALATGGGI